MRVLSGRLRTRPPRGALHVEKSRARAYRALRVDSVRAYRRAARNFRRLAREGDFTTAGELLNAMTCWARSQTVRGSARYRNKWAAQWGRCVWDAGRLGRQRPDRAKKAGQKW